MASFGLTVAIVVTLAMAPPVLAAQCPALIRSVYDAAANRFDQRAYDAREKAAEAARLHGEGRHADAEKIANEGRELLGLGHLFHATR